jgi:hypothetical protein
LATDDGQDGKDTDAGAGAAKAEPDEAKGSEPTSTSVKKPARTKGTKKKRTTKVEPRPAEDDAPTEGVEAPPEADAPVDELPAAARGTSLGDEGVPVRTLFTRAFLEIDRRVLALFRVMLAGTLLYELARRAVHTTALFSNHGLLPNHYVQYAPQNVPQFSIYLPFSEPDEVGFAFVLTALVYVLLGVGFHTRVMSVLAFFCAFSLNTRNLFLEDGGCAALSIMAAWAMFLPLGDRFSVDALRRGVRAELEGTPESREAITAPHRSIAVLGIVLQMALIYFFNALHKKGLTWRDGSAVHYVLWQNRLNTSFAVWLRMHEPAFFSPLMSYGTLLLEAALPALVLSPYYRVRARTFAVLAAISLHLGIALTMTLGPFSYAMIALDLLLLPGEALDYVRDRWLTTRDDVVLTIRGDEMGPRWVAALYRTLSAGRFTVETDPHADARFATRLGEGAQAAEGDVEEAQALLEAALAPPVRLVAKGLAPLARLQLGWDAPWVDLPKTRRLPLTSWRESLVGLFIVGMLLQMSVDNPAVPKWLRFAPPGPLKVMNDYPRLIQAWNMFSPDAPIDDGILVVDAVTVSGQHIDPFTGAEPDFERVHHRPVAQSTAMADYLTAIHMDSNRRHRRDFERYVFEWHNRQKLPATQRIMSFEAYWVSHDSPKPGSVEPTNLRKELAFSGKR